LIERLFSPGFHFKQVTEQRKARQKGRGPEQLRHVEAARREDRVDRIADLAAEEVPVHPVVALHVPDDRLDRLPPFEPALERFGQSPRRKVGRS